MAKQTDRSLPPDYFEQVYAAKSDPWDFANSEYERTKYADTLAHLPRTRYSRGFEVGCSIGVLTSQLGKRCDSLLSVDVAETALTQARRRCEGMPGVQIERMQVPEEQPQGSFDLIVVSEVGYYWSPQDQVRAMEMLAAHQESGGHLVLVHWTPEVHDYPQTGDEVHGTWIIRPEWSLRQDIRRERYRLSVLERTEV